MSATLKSDSIKVKPRNEVLGKMVMHQSLRAVVHGITTLACIAPCLAVNARKNVPYFFKLVEMKNDPSQQPCQTHASSQSQIGQSLMETLFVLLIVAVLCASAASNLPWMQSKFQVQSAAEDMLNAVLTARTEALRRETRVTLCVAQQAIVPLTCAPIDSGAFVGAWQQGWLMFEDSNSNGLWDSGEALLMQHAALKAQVSATGNEKVNRYISFGATGRSLMLSSAFQAGTLTFCERQTTRRTGWLLILNAVGHPRLEKAVIAQCL